MLEVYKDIPGYEGLYQVSDLGNVRSFDREIKTKNGHSYIREGRVLKPSPDMEGRLGINLHKDSKYKSYKVHTLVALTFIGERPEGYHVCHKDGDFNNNKLSNIRFDTQSQNRIDMYRYGSKNVRGKLSIEQVLEIRKLYSTGNYYQYELAEMFNVYQSSIGRIVLRKTFDWLNEDGTIDESKTSVS